MNAICQLLLVNFKDKLVGRQWVEHLVLLAQLCHLFDKLFLTLLTLNKLFPARHTEHLKILRITKPFNHLNFFHQRPDQRHFQIFQRYIRRLGNKLNYPVNELDVRNYI